MIENRYIFGWFENLPFDLHGEWEAINIHHPSLTWKLKMMASKKESRIPRVPFSGEPC